MSISLLSQLLQMPAMGRKPPLGFHLNMQRFWTASGCASVSLAVPDAEALECRYGWKADILLRSNPRGFEAVIRHDVQDDVYGYDYEMSPRPII